VKFILLFTAVFFLSGCTDKSVQDPAAAAGGGATPGVAVTTGVVTMESAPLEVDVTGTVDASSRVEIKSQVAGQIESVHFTEGQDVTAGQVLLTIDKRPYEDALHQAQAAVERDQAQIAQAQAVAQRDAAQAKAAEADAARYATLASDKLISEQQRLQYATASETAAAALRADQAGIETARASLKVDQAAVERAQLDIGYCEIKAPMAGRTGNLLVKAGNLVKVNDVALLVINRIDPVFVNFNAPERYLGTIQRENTARRLPVEIESRDGADTRATGELSVVDNTVDTQTGTIHLKATLANPRQQWWPGQFVDSKLLLDPSNRATVAPAEAVQNGQNGPYVYVVKPDQTVEVRNVTVARTLERRAIIESGLKPGEVVVTDGQMMLAPGAKVAAGSPGAGSDAAASGGHK
jgi:multidrug efflux system membrane fusion protein